MRNRYVLIGDILITAISAAVAFTLRFDLRAYQYRAEFIPYLATAVVLRPIVFYFFGMYRRLWRYASVPDLVAVAMATVVSTLALGVAVSVAVNVDPTLEFSRPVVLIDALLVLVLTSGLRLAVRILAESPVHANDEQQSGKRVLIAGAGAAGVMVVRELQRNPQLGMVAVGFLDDDRAKVGKHVHGVAVLGTLRSLVTIARAHRVDEVLIAIPTAAGPVLRALAEHCRVAGLPSRTIPGVFELLDGQVSVSRLREIQITDLLRRAPISDISASPYLTERIVLVTGAGGSIGSELCRQVAASRPARLVLLGHGENSLFDAQLELRDLFPGLAIELILADVRDRSRLMTSISRVRPSVVFHAAAHKHVPMVEENPEEAISNNILGTKNLVDAALAAGTERLVMISTDKAVAPTNLMGASKRVAELIVRDAARRTGSAFVVVRFGNVLGSRGSVVPVFKRQIERGGPITVTHPEMSRYFMTIPEAVHLVLRAGGIGRGDELFVLDMGTPVRIVDLARDLIALSGYGPDEIPIVFTRVRPGEKMTEALWEKDAAVERTVCQGVLRVVESESSPVVDVNRMLERLSQAASSGDRLQIQAELARWIPSYVPSEAVRGLSLET